MKLFVALVVLCCALSAHGECHFEYPQFNGGVLDENGYIPDSVLAWVDVAKNYFDYADENGKYWLNEWIKASQCYNRNMTEPDVNPEGARYSINYANTCFCNLGGSFQNSQVCEWYKYLCEYFGGLLANGTDAQVNQFMVEAYPQFNSYVC